MPEEYSQVQTAVVFAGQKAGVVGRDSMLRRTFQGAGETNVWIDFYARFQPRAYDLAPIPSDDAVASFYFNSSGKVVAYSNSTWVTLNSFTMPANAWRRFTVNLDYIGSNWAIYAAGNVPNELSTPVATNLAFAAGVTNKVFTQFRVKN